MKVFYVVRGCFYLVYLIFGWIFLGKTIFDEV